MFATVYIQCLQYLQYLLYIYMFYYGKGYFKPGLQ